MPFDANGRRGDAVDLARVSDDTVGHAVARIGAPTLSALGALTLMAGGAIMVGWSEAPRVGSGAGYRGHMAAFTLSQSVIGVGWNWCFVAATSSLAKQTRPSERAKVQAANDVAVFSLSGVVGVLAGVAFRAFGWRAMQIATFIAGGLILLTVSVSEGLTRWRSPPAPRVDDTPLALPQ